MRPTLTLSPPNGGAWPRELRDGIPPDWSHGERALFASIMATHEPIATQEPTWRRRALDPTGSGVSPRFANTAKDLTGRAIR